MTDGNAGEIPSMKLYESDKTFAFLDINPLVGLPKLLAIYLKMNQS